MTRMLDWEHEEWLAGEKARKNAAKKSALPPATQRHGKTRMRKAGDAEAKRRDDERRNRYYGTY